ncbi:hypothetical protein [Actinomadura verrucosospora]|uniref:Uncharacterized protein n=1 Tax=Actinomadura verrucosospora TaxID=46165 RepID=A0A7D3W2S6_ACTVE|nr:hypothetical protein [Actinomadura verrucosospora]QKG24711.1 hypothetical protein ACTIVE_6360 [Actinomadura verrucosospora]
MLRLNTGPSTAAWTAWLGCMGPVMLALNVALGALCAVFITDPDLQVVGALGLVPLVLLDGLIIILSVQYYRGAFWLDGRTLVRRGFPGRRRYDLTSAEVTVESAQPLWTPWRGGVLPRLIVRTSGGGTVRMWLRDPVRRGALLPPDQLAALAQAIDPWFRHPVAGRLRQLAADPLHGTL